MWLSTGKPYVRDLVQWLVQPGGAMRGEFALLGENLCRVFRFQLFPLLGRGVGLNWSGLKVRLFCVVLMAGYCVVFCWAVQT